LNSNGDHNHPAAVCKANKRASEQAKSVGSQTSNKIDKFMVMYDIHLLPDAKANNPESSLEVVTFINKIIAMKKYRSKKLQKIIADKSLVF